jgi:histidine triad (HIT) family protein
MRRKTDIYGPPMTTPDLVSAAIRLLEEATFEPDSDYGKTVRQLGRFAVGIKELWEHPIHRSVFFTNPALRAAKNFSSGYYDVLPEWLEYDRDSAAPQRREQLERRIRAMLEELYAQRPKLIQLLEEHAMRADWRHEPENYACPFCALISPDFPGDGINAPSDVFLRTERTTAFIAPKWWPNNVGHALVIPNAHHENLYDLPAEHGHAVHDAVREVAIAIRATYGCAGVSTRQHNEPAGYQDVWHLHVHVFPRYPGDELYSSMPLPEFAPRSERAPYAERLRDYLTLSRTQAR